MAAILSRPQCVITPYNRRVLPCPWLRTCLLYFKRLTKVIAFVWHVIWWSIDMRCIWSVPLHWRYNGYDVVPHHQPHDCLLNCLFRPDQRKHQSSTSLAFVWGIHRWPVNSPHKGPVAQKMFPFDDVIMQSSYTAFCTLFCSSTERNNLHIRMTGDNMKYIFLKQTIIAVSGWWH